ERFYKPWESPSCLFGNLAVIGFFLVQFLDGGLTYLGVSIWGPSIEANPLLASAITHAGLATSLTAAKSVAIAFGIVLHLYRVHTLVAVLTIFYIAAAIVPWTALFLAS
ncbi:MAG TPA: hypothetical protein VJP86_05315, partial [Vicinamibacterales bacterium]|nr:hypothetical protein [Vicinamibacterales bacterium]